MSTMLLAGEGTADASGDVITYYSSMTDPMSGGTMEMKSVSTMVNDNKQRFEMFHKQPDGSWHRQMELVAKRAK